MTDAGQHQQFVLNAGGAEQRVDVVEIGAYEGVVRTYQHQHASRAQVCRTLQRRGRRDRTAPVHRPPGVDGHDHLEGQVRGGDQGHKSPDAETDDADRAWFE